MKFTGWKEVVLGLVCTIAAFCIGMFCPLVTTKVNWTYIVFAYIFLVTVACGAVSGLCSTVLHDYVRIRIGIDQSGFCCTYWSYVFPGVVKCIGTDHVMCIPESNRQNKTLLPPLIIMLCVTFTALVERTIALVKAYSAGSASFLVEGLQLIIAILLMITGVIIVIHSGKKLVQKKADK